MGRFNGGNFRAIQEYFQQKSCRFCDRHFTAEGIQLLREDPGVLVVRIGCSLCGKPLGIAIVGTGAQPSPDCHHPLEWTKRDVQKLSHQPPITYDDVLNAHQFYDSLGADWSRHLPRPGRTAH